MNPSLKKCLSRPRLAFVAASIALVAITVTGCHLGQPAAASFASVTISGKSRGEIRDATIAVFRENGYQVFGSSQGLTFEKEGSKANSIARDGFVSSHYGAVTIIRVRAELVDLGKGAQRLQCQAYMVSGAGDSFFENESRLANFRGGPYQDLLDEVAKQLKQP